MDHMHGVCIVSKKWMIGNSVMEINQDDDNFIAGKQYKGILGLYELLFTKYLEDCDKHDLTDYKCLY